LNVHQAAVFIIFWPRLQILHLGELFKEKFENGQGDKKVQLHRIYEIPLVGIYENALLIWDFYIHACPMYEMFRFSGLFRTI